LLSPGTLVRYNRIMQALSPSTVRPRVLIADDHSIVAAGLRLVLEKSCDVIGIIQDGRQLLIEAPKLKPDVIVLDIGMPFLNGLDAAERLKPLLPGVKFVFLTMMNDPNLAAAALNLGAVGYVLKESVVSELLKAVSEVLHGKSYVTPRLQAENWAVREARAQQLSKGLTPRQKDVLQLLAEGRRTKEIADILNVSERTVMFHKYHIMQSFNLKSNADLVLLAIKHHLISA
jgi:DNA-binding NarL/FixJ family response regulator